MVTYSAADAVYTCSRRNKLPERHLALGVTVTSMKVVVLLPCSINLVTVHVIKQCEIETY